MNAVDYKEKYLKYKNKYIELKTQQEQKNIGGFMYAPGEYIFFIPESKKQLVDNELLVKNKTVLSLDKLTNNLGNCTRFLRIGSNVNNKTIYTNQSSFDVIKRETKDVKDKTVQGYNVAKEETKKAWDVSKPYVDKTWEATKQGAKVVADATSQGFNMTKDMINKPAQKGGVDTGCDKSPIILSRGLNGFGFDNEVNETNLVNYIKLINEKQGSEKIGRVVVIQKKTNTFGLGGETKIKYDFDVLYSGDEFKVTKK